MTQSTNFELTKSRFLNAAMEAFKSYEISRVELIHYLVVVGKMTLPRAYMLSTFHVPNPNAKQKAVGASDDEMGVVLSFNGALGQYGEDI